MKILIFNIIGVANGVKWRCVRDIAIKKQIEMLIIQETKLQEVSSRLCGALWGDGDFEWKASPSINRAGDLICIWNRGLFKLHDCFMGNFSVRWFCGERMIWLV